jgi:hypothetical protein
LGASFGGASFGGATLPPHSPTGVVSGPPPYAPTIAQPVAPKNAWWIALVIGGIALLLLGGGTVALVLLLQPSDGTAIVTPPVLGGGAGGKMRIESGLEKVPFAGSKADVEKAQSALEGRLAPCFASGTNREHMFTADIVIARDGKITSVSEEMVCQETATPTHYICTDRGQAKPKPKHPVAPESIFACIDRTLRATKLPPLKIADPEKTTIHIDFKG